MPGPIDCGWNHRGDEPARRRDEPEDEASGHVPPSPTLLHRCTPGACGGQICRRPNGPCAGAGELASGNHRERSGRDMGRMLTFAPTRPRQALGMSAFGGRTKRTCCGRSAATGCPGGKAPPDTRRAR